MSACFRIGLSSLVLAAPFCTVTVAEAACPPLPHTITNGQVADATKVMDDLEALRNCAGAGGSTNSVQINAGGGTQVGVGPLTDGQLVIGSTGNAPQAATITAGPGITITNGPGSVSIASSSGANDFQREFGPFAPPASSSFTFIDTPSSITPTVTNVANVGLVYSAPVTNNTTSTPGAYRAVPTASSWTLTFRAKFSTLMGNYPQFGVWIKDTSGKMVGQTIESKDFIIKRNNSNTSFNSNTYTASFLEAPNWFRVKYDGENIEFYLSWDGQNWLFTWSEPKSAFLNGNLQLIGIGGLTGVNNAALWRPGSKTGGVITYWDIDDDPASGRMP